MESFRTTGLYVLGTSTIVTKINFWYDTHAVYNLWIHTPILGHLFRHYSNIDRRKFLIEMTNPAAVTPYSFRLDFAEQKQKNKTLSK